jgi:protein O-mannosyl-transferase
MRLLQSITDRKAVFALLLTLLATTVAYYPGLRGPFVFDDQPNISLNANVALTDLKPRSLLRAALSNDSGPLKRVLPALTFGLNYYIAGGVTDTFPYKVSNLLIHLLNICLVYWLSSLLIGRLYADDPNNRIQAWLPVLSAAAWALHPLQLTSVLYVVQRMTSLSAMFVLAGLITFLYGRLRLRKGRRYGYTLMTGGLLGGLLLGLTSKENAVLLPLLAVVVEFVFFDHSAETAVTRRRLRLYYGLILVLPIVAALIWLALHPEMVLGIYSWRDFTLAQRLLTETRVLWFYVGLTLFPRIDAFGIYHDDIAISTGLLTPWTTLPAVLGLVGAAAAALVYRRRYPLFSFAVLWFLAAHSMESSFIGLEIAHEHRNYLPSFGLIMAGACGVAFLAQRLARPRIGVALLAFCVSMLAFVTYSRAHTWSSEDRIIETQAGSHPRSPRSQYMLAELYAQRKGDPLAAMRYYRRTAELDPTDADALIKLVITASSTTINGAAPDAAGTADFRVPGLPEFVSVTRLEGRTSLKVNDAIVREIERRLRKELVHPFTSFSLGRLSSCVVQGEKACAHLFEKAVHWYQLALANPRSNNLARSYLAGGLARLYLEHGDYTEALGAAKQSRQYDPSNAELWLEEAEVYLRLNDPEQAASVIKRTRQTHAPLDATTSKKVQDLLARIDTKLKTKDTQ